MGWEGGGEKDEEDKVKRIGKVRRREEDGVENGQRQGRMPMEGNWDRDSRQEGVWIWEDHLMCNIYMWQHTNMTRELGYTGREGWYILS